MNEEPSRIGKFLSGLLAATGVAVAVAISRGSYEDFSFWEGVGITAAGIVGGMVLIGLAQLILSGWDRLRSR